MKIGAFHLEEPIGQGAMGVVWGARHEATGVAAAVKIATTTMKSPEEGWAEARAVAALSHPGVVRLYDRGLVDAEAAQSLGVAEGAGWIAMERARGSLRERPEGDKLRRRLAEILDALAHAHARGVVHLDLKPGNLLVADDGALMLGDFGIARILGEASDGRIRGSLPTMAPEQLAGEALGPWTDLYAVGCIAFAWITGSWPWPDLPLAAALDARRQSAVVLPEGGPVAEWIAALTAPMPQDRPACAALAARALAGLTLRGGHAPADHATVVTALTGVASGPTEDLPRLTPNEGASSGPLRGRSAGVDVVGLSLLPFRRRPLVGRVAVQDWLGEALGEVVSTGQALVVGLRAGPGLGRTAVLREFLEEAHRRGEATALGYLGTAAEPDVVRLDAGADPADLPGSAARRPLVVGLDDVVDRPAWRKRLGALAREERPILVVVTARADEAAAVAPVSRWYDLEPLEAADVAEVLSGMVELEPEIAGRLVARAGGCPAWAVHHLQGWAQAGLLRPGPRGWALASDEPPLASDLAASLRMPLQRFLDDQPDAVGALALLEPPVDLGLWASVASGADEALIQALVATGSLTQTGGLRFVSQATREAVASWLSPDVQVRLHQQILRALPEAAPARQRGRHALGAGDALAARRPLRDAVFERLNAGEVREASLVERDLARALEGLAPDDPERAHHHLGRAQLALLQGRAAEAIVDAEVAARIAEEPGLAARSRQIGAAATQRSGDLRGALVLLGQAAAGFALAQNGSRRVECLASAEEIHTMLGDEASANEALAQALSRIDEADDSVAGVTLARAGWRYASQGRTAEALAALDAAEVRFHRTGQALLLAITASYRGHTLRRAGDLEGARAENLRAVARFEACGSADADVVRLGNLQLELDADRPEVVGAEADRLARRFARQGRKPHEIAARALSLWSRARGGDRDALREDLGALAERIGTTGLGSADLKLTVARLAEALADRPDLAQIVRESAP